MRELSDDELDAIVRKTWGNGWMLPGEPQRMLVRAGYAAGYAAAQAAMPPREPTPEMVAAGTAAHSRSPVFEAQRIIDIWYAMHDAHTFAEDSARYYGFPPDDAGPLDHQSAAGTNCAAEDGARPSPESARGPAADPIADLCERLRYIGMFEDDRRDGISPMCREAADALERLARENAALRAFYGDQHIRDRLANAEQVETENDALRAIVRAADKLTQPGTENERTRAYDRARAKWEGKP